MSNSLLAMLAAAGVSLVPMLELRAGIPLGISLGLPAALATVAGIVGNIFQFPLAIGTVTWARRVCHRYPRVEKWLQGLENSARRHEGLIRRWGWLGLTLFVVLPLPGTGVWGGVVLARLIGMRLSAMWLGVSLGIAISGTIFGLASHGVVRLFGF